MLAPLPEYLDPLQLADRQVELRGRLPLAAMSRLVETLVDDAGEAEVELRFDRDAGGRRLLQGALRATVTVTCQRCLGACELSLRSELRLAIVGSEDEAERLPEEFDPLLAEGRLRTLTLVEDELILAMPLVPMHSERSACVPEEALRKGPPDASEPTAQARKNPFAALAALKKRDN